MTERGRLESALEQFLDTSAHSRRRFLGRAALFSGLATTLSACGIKGTAEKNFAELQAQARAVHHPKVPIGDWTFSNWPLYIDKKVLKEFDAKYGGHV
jgi:spermidine/putrescine transport system substrate-binding protein